ncbi:MAG: DUF1684 domain-containing protein [Cyclobacteriaceae bacterium]|nr:DUF1684 domain-containing protein [Cyclobacteriaceae bacterium]UYN85662.1 MAG: DUF1684 domain-containing protein [Cyclobacteriaceae bacterium]
MNTKINFLFLFTALVAGCTSSVRQDKSFDTEAYLEEIIQWQQKRNAYQVSEEGWVNLAGLFWLKDGINTFGSGKSNDFVFPEGKIPERAGFLLLKQGVVMLETTDGLMISVNGKPTSSGVIFHPDSSRNIMEYGSLRWFVIKRDDKIGIRLRDLDHPNLKAFSGIDCFDIDPAWRVEGRVEWADSSRTIEITNVLGQTLQQRSVGTLVFTWQGNEYRLDALDEGGDEFFVIFGDETNARETYGAGRYMYVPVPVSGDNVIIDFNKSYNPPCAFTEFATCPLPPKQNILPFAVPVGEKNYRDH